MVGTYRMMPVAWPHVKYRRAKRCHGASLQLYDISSLTISMNDLYRKCTDQQYILRFKWRPVAKTYDWDAWKLNYQTNGIHNKSMNKASFDVSEPLVTELVESAIWFSLGPGWDPNWLATIIKPFLSGKSLYLRCFLRTEPIVNLLGS